MFGNYAGQPGTSPAPALPAPGHGRQGGGAGRVGAPPEGGPRDRGDRPPGPPAAGAVAPARHCPLEEPGRRSRAPARSRRRAPDSEFSLGFCFVSGLFGFFFHFSSPSHPPHPEDFQHPTVLHSPPRCHPRRAPPQRASTPPVTPGLPSYCPAVVLPRRRSAGTGAARPPPLTGSPLAETSP